MVKGSKGKDLGFVEFKGCAEVNKDLKRAIECSVVITDKNGKKTKHNVDRLNFEGIERGKIDLENI